MTTCWRCGIKFSGTGGDACQDCRETLDQSGPVLWSKNGRQAHLRYDSDRHPHIMERRQAAIRELWNLGLNDQEISKRLDISDRTVLRWRHRMGLSANSTGRVGPMHPDTLRKLQAGWRRYRDEQTRKS